MTFSDGLLIYVIKKTNSATINFVHLCKALESNTIDSGAKQINCIIIINCWVMFDQQLHCPTFLVIKHNLSVK